MQNIIKELVEKAGLTTDQATKSIQVMKEFIQTKLPPGFSAMVDNFFAEQNKEEDILEPQSENINGNHQTGHDSTNAAHASESAFDKIKDFAQSANETLSDWLKDAEEKGEDAISKLKDILGGDKKS